LNFLKAPIGYPLLVLLSAPFIRPFKISRILGSYILPVAPLVALWDGVVSELRTYSVAELKKLVGSVESEGYKWEIGTKDTLLPGMRITYLIGYPV